MKRKLVIHIGASKCGSTSIQVLLERIKRTSNSDFEYRHLSPLKEGAAWLSADSASWQHLQTTLANQSTRQIVISHELLGEPTKESLVCRIADRALHRFSFDQVVIVGYTRRQWSRCISSFGQWWFRSRFFLKENSELLARHGLPWRKFSALERCMIMNSLQQPNRSYPKTRLQSYADYYSNLFSGLQHLGDRVTVVSKHIPTRKLPYSLESDFITSSQLALTSLDLDSIATVHNASFNPILINGIASHTASLAPDDESFFPGPHDGNELLSYASDRVGSHESEIERFAHLFATDFMRLLEEHMDCSWAPDNHKYCELMSVNFDYFRPSRSASPLTAKEICSLANDVASRRRLVDMEEFNRITEKISIQEFRAALLSSSPPQTGIS